MVRTASTMLTLGTKAPPFELVNVDSRTISLADFKDAKALLVIFMCNHCPFVKHVAQELVDLARDYQPRGVAIVGINSNDTAAHPDDSPEQMVQEAEQRGYTFPYLFDEDQAVAKAYRAACTPDFFLFDGQQRLVYRGQLDGSRPNTGIPVTGKDLRAALDAVLAGQPVPDDQNPSIGCNIKWKPGNEPNYFDTIGAKQRPSFTLIASGASKLREVFSRLLQKLSVKLSIFSALLGPPTPLSIWVRSSCFQG